MGIEYDRELTFAVYNTLRERLIMVAADNGETVGVNITPEAVTIHNGGLSCSLKDMLAYLANPDISRDFKRYLDDLYKL